MVAAKRAEPGDDLLSALVTMRDEGDSLTETELGSMLLLLGFETTASQIATGLLALITYPDQLAALRAEPGLIPAAVEEMVRWQGAAMASLSWRVSPNVRGLRLVSGFPADVPKRETCVPKRATRVPGRATRVRKRTTRVTGRATRREGGLGGVVVAGAVGGLDGLEGLGGLYRVGVQVDG